MVYIYIILVYSKTRMSKHRTICARTKAAAAYYLGYRIPHLLRLVRIPSWNSAILPAIDDIWSGKNNAKWILIVIWTTAIVWTIVFLAPANSLDNSPILPTFITMRRSWSHWVATRHLLRSVNAMLLRLVKRSRWTGGLVQDGAWNT